MIGAVLPDLSCFDRPEMIKMVKNRLCVRAGDIARLAVDELAKCRSGAINVIGITTVGKRPDDGTARTHLSRKLTEKPKQIGYVLINMGPKDKAHPCARNRLRQGDVPEHIIDLNHPICAPQRAALGKASQLVCGADIGVAHIPIRSGQEGATNWSDFDPKFCRGNTARDKIEESGIPLFKHPRDRRLAQWLVISCLRCAQRIAQSLGYRENFQRGYRGFGRDAPLLSRTSAPSIRPPVAS